MAKQDAAGVDQENLAIGLQGAEDDGRINANDAIQDRTGSALLNETRRLGCANRETLPVNNRVRGVGDGKCAALLGEAGLAVDHHGSGRIGVNDSAEG